MQMEDKQLINIKQIFYLQTFQFSYAIFMYIMVSNGKFLNYYTCFHCGHLYSFQKHYGMLPNLCIIVEFICLYIMLQLQSQFKISYQKSAQFI